MTQTTRNIFLIILFTSVSLLLISGNSAAQTRIELLETNSQSRYVDVNVGVGNDVSPVDTAVVLVDRPIRGSPNRN